MDPFRRSLLDRCPLLSRVLSQRSPLPARHPAQDFLGPVSSQRAFQRLLDGCKERNRQGRGDVARQTRVDEVCKLLKQNNDTFLSLKLVHCRFSLDCFNKVYSSLYYNVTCIHGIKCFSVTSSSIFEYKWPLVPSGLLESLSSGSSLIPYLLEAFEKNKSFI